MKISDLWTENDGKSLCPVRLIGLAGAAQFFVLTGLQFHKSGSFDIGSYGTALAEVIGAVGLAFAAKSHQEARALSSTADALATVRGDAQ